MKKTLGFIGLGLMGGWMVRHLLNDQYKVHVYDIDEQKMNDLAAYGAIAEKNIKDLPSKVDVIILSLPNSQIVEDVIQQMDLYNAPKSGLIILDTSTADPSISTELAKALLDKGMYFMDATVSGTSEMCAAKDTIFMVGGIEDIYQNCKTIFSSMGRESIYMGKSGTGAAIKLVVNLVLAINRVGLAEGLTLAKVAGIDQALALEVLKKSAAFSKAMDQKGYRMVNREFYPPIGHMSTHYKDVQLMVSYASKLKCPVPVISFTAQALASEMLKRPGDRDSSAIICFYDDLIINNG
jgi:3-hydroxyisobutyrate dehydrogenase-like beta-hydroxyacid dehydrogenase